MEDDTTKHFFYLEKLGKSKYGILLAKTIHFTFTSNIYIYT